jgi:hypothetical protein
MLEQIRIHHKYRNFVQINLMKKEPPMKHLLIPLLFLSACEEKQGPEGPTGPQGEQGDPGDPGQNGTDGATALIKTTPEDPGTNCSSGGVKISYGVDDNGSAELDPDEIDGEEVVCHGDSAASGNVYLGNLTITNDEAFTVFCSTYTSMHGDLLLTGSGIDSLADFSCLESVYGDVTISYTGLMDLGGLENLEMIAGDLNILFNSLTNLQGLSSLTTISSVIEICHNGNLPQSEIDSLLSGFSNNHTVSCGDSGA